MAVLHIFSSIKLYDAFLTFSILIIVYICYFYYKYFTRLNPIPGPLPLPFVIGNILDRGFDEFVEYTERMHKKYGDIYEVYYGGQRFIMIRDFEYMKKMFDYSVNSKYLRRVGHFSGLDELYVAGKGVALNHNVHVWKFNRHFISRAFLTPGFSEFSVEQTQKLVEEMMNYWKDGADEDESYIADLVEWSERFTTNAITNLITGINVYTMEAYYNELLLSRNKKPKDFGHDMTDSTNLFKSIKTFIAGIYFFIVIPPFMRKYIPILNKESERQIQNRIWLFNKLDKLVRQRRKEIEYTPLEQPLRYDMLTSMLTAYTDRDICEIKYDDEDEQTRRPLTNDEIVGTLLETFIGGTESTANTFTFVAYFMANYPDVLQRLRKELDSFFEKLGDQRLNIECLSELVYTEAIIKEILRIYTPAPYTARNSTAKDILEGQSWPEGTQYIINLHGMSNSEKYWDEPEKFNPDRWLNNKKNEKLMPQVSFGGGRRVCPGKKLSFIELKILMALVYHKLDVELVDKSTPLKTKFLLLRSFPELMVRIKPRQKIGDF